MRSAKCHAFTPIECVNGHCPRVLSEEYEWYEDAGYDASKGCKHCRYNTGNCKDCIFEKTADCPLTNATSRDIIKLSN